MISEGDSDARWGDGRLKVGNRLAVGLKTPVLIVMVLEERYAVILQEGLHVTTEVPSVGADRRELVVGWGKVVNAGGRKAELNGLVEFLRRGKELQLLARLGIAVVGSLGVEYWGLGRVRRASSGGGLRM